jgi:hypothetical protein
MRRNQPRNDAVSRGLRTKQQALDYMRKTGTRDFRAAVEAVRRNERP